MGVRPRIFGKARAETGLRGGLGAWAGSALSGPAAAHSLGEAQGGLEFPSFVTGQRAQGRVEAVGVLSGQERQEQQQCGPGVWVERETSGRTGPQIPSWPGPCAPRCSPPRPGPARARRPHLVGSCSQPERGCRRAGAQEPRRPPAGGESLTRCRRPSAQGEAGSLGSDTSRILLFHIHDNWETQEGPMQHGGSNFF